MNVSNQKISTKDISKEQLEHLYFKEKMTLDEIGRSFGFYDRQPITRLFKKFGLSSRNLSERANALSERKKMSTVIPSKEELENHLNQLSITKVSKIYNVSRNQISKWMKLHDLKTEYFNNSNIKYEINDIKYDDMSPKELAILFDTEINVVKYYRKKFKKCLYDRNTIIEKIEKYSYDFTNQGATKQIKYDDENLFDSIFELTKDHVLQSNKLTERLYRIVNEYTPEHVDVCKFCNSKLKFYTYNLGYGNSNHKICKSCSHSLNGVSLVSQKLFWKVYNSLDAHKKNLCNFSELNNEKKISISSDDKKALKNYRLNKNHYYFDFICEKKIIEFDGDFYHTDDEKEFAKDQFANHKGFEILHIKENDFYKNPDETIKRCLDFLNQ